jgi:hypothetical protein
MAKSVPACLVAVGLLAGGCGSGPQDKPLTPEQQDAIARAAGKPGAGAPVSTLMSRLAGSGSGSKAAALVRQSTTRVYESPYKQVRKEVPNRLLTDFNTTSGPRFPARVNFEDLDWLAALPAPKDEVPGVRIGWYLNSALGALQAGIEQKKPVVLVVGEPTCDYCVKVALAARCSAVERLAGEAVFAFSILSRDTGAAAIASSLEITADPTITILEPEARMLLERGRLNGFKEATPFGEFLEEVIWRTPQQPYTGDDAATTPTITALPRASRAPTAADAEAGAKQRGLVHGLPAPVCR